MMQNSRRRPVVLHVTECFEGGVGKAIRSYADNTDAFEHQLLAVGNDVDDERNLSRFARVTDLEDGLWKRVSQIRQIASAGGADLIHAHSSWAGVYARLRSMSVPIVYEPHGYAFEMASRVRRLSYFSAERLLGLRRIAATAVLSPREELLARTVSPGSSVILIPNSPTIARYLSDPAEALIRPAPIITMIGRVCAQKDPEYFVRLLEEVRVGIPDARGRWIGDGDFHAVEVLKAAGVEVTGWRDPKSLTAKLDETSVYVHTAQYEGFPLSVLDAAARRVPIHARAIPAFDGSPIAQHLTVRDHADAVVRTVEDPEHRASIVSLGEELLALMNSSEQENKLTTLYRRAMQR